jgi:hypothetical protein
MTYCPDDLISPRRTHSKIGLEILLTQLHTELLFVATHVEAPRSRISIAIYEHLQPRRISVAPP